MGTLIPRRFICKLRGWRLYLASGGERRWNGHIWRVADGRCESCGEVFIP